MPRALLSTKTTLLDCTLIQIHLKVTDVGAKVICIAIKMIPALKLLSLSRNALPDESKRALYDAWSKREVEEGQEHSGM